MYNNNVILSNFMKSQVENVENVENEIQQLILN